jgi:hypothetical protein
MHLMNVDPFDEEPRENSKAEVPSKLDILEQKSRIWINFSKLLFIAIAAVVAGFFNWALAKREDARQQAQVDAELSKPWLDEALKVLREQSTPGQAKTENPMLEWAIEVFQKYSPAPVDNDLKKQLRSGAVKFERMGTEIRSLNWNFDFSTETREGAHRLGKGLNFIVL